MADERITEKVYCYDHPSAYHNNDALIAAMCSKPNCDPMASALLNRSNDMWNNPFIYLVWLMFAGRFNGGWGNGDCRGTQDIETQNQLQAIRSQLQDNQNSSLLMDAIKGNNVAIGQLAQNLNCDFNTLNSCCCDMKQAIAQVGGQIGFSAERVINAVNMGDCNVIQALKDCCCTTQKAILEQGYQNQLANCHQTNTIMTGINGVNTGVERGFANMGNIVNQGFAQVGYETQKQTCDIINAGNANTQRIIDTLNAHWKDEQALQIQDLKFQLSQERQNSFLLNRLGGNGCTCLNGCGQ